MPDQEVKHRFISSIAELGAPPKLRREPVILPEIQVKDPAGKGTVAAAFYEYELNTGEHGEFDICDRVFDEAGNIIRIKRGGRDVAFLAFCTRDGDGNRLFQTIEAAEAVLKQWGKSITGRMLQAANKANYGEVDVMTVDDAVQRAEGNSEET